MNIWVQKSRLKLKGGRRGWHCNEYLDGVGEQAGKPYPSGGRNSTKSPQSMACIRHIQPGDLVWLYQVDDDSIHAVTQADSCGMEADKGSRQYNLFYLKPAATAFRFAPPLTITQLRSAGCNPECFGPGMNGRIFPLLNEEFVGVIQAITTLVPEQGKQLLAWMRQHMANE